MTKQTKQYKITILNNEYSLVSDEAEQHVLNTVHFVNSLMNEVQEKSRSTDPAKVAVLASLQIASELLRLQDEKKRSLEEYSALIDTIEKQLQGSQG